MNVCCYHVIIIFCYKVNIICDQGVQHLSHDVQKKF